MINRVIGIQENNEFLSYNMTCTCRKVHNGCKSILSAIEPKLKVYILDLCQKDIQLTIQMVQREASRLLLALKEKSQQSKELVVPCVTRSAGLIQHSATHMTQKNFLKAAADAKDLMAMVRDELDGRNPDDVLNMDQMPIVFSYHPNKMLDVKATKTIHTRMSTSDTKHATLMTIVTVSRIMLPPYLIFKGKPNGHIALHEFLMFPAARTYECQDKAWMDEGRMHEWINIVLRPWEEARDLNQPCMQPPILILDSYCIHQMGSVINRIQLMRGEVSQLGAHTCVSPLTLGLTNQ